MNRSRLHPAALALLAVAAGSMSIPAAAQVGGTAAGGGAQARRPQMQRPPQRNWLPEYAEIVQQTADRFKVKIVVDPALFVAAKPGAPDPSLNLVQSLQMLAGQPKKTVARRLYLSQQQAANMPAPAKLVAAARALEQIDQTGIVMENPGQKRATSYIKNYDVPEDFERRLADQQFSPNGVYVIFSTLGDGMSPMDRFAALQREQMDMMMNMSPEDLQAAMGQSMAMWQNMDPATRSQMMGTMMKAGMQMWMSMPDDQRNALMQDMMGQLGGLFGGARKP